MISINQKKYDTFNKNLNGLNFILNNFIFESQSIKDSMFVNDKRNFPFYYFIGKNSLFVSDVAQIGLCGGYNLGMYLMGNNNIKNVYIYDNKNNNNLLRLTKNNLLKFNFSKKHYFSSLLNNDFLSSIKENKLKLLFINDKDYIVENINMILSFFVDCEELQNLVLDNIIDLGSELENHVISYCNLRNIDFKKYNKRNEAIILRKI